MKFLHVRPKKRGKLKAKGGYTIGWTPSENDYTFKIVVAFCSHKDNFCKRVARSICEGRMKKDKWLLWDLDGRKPREAVMNDHLSIHDMYRAIWLDGE